MLFSGSSTTSYTIKKTLQTSEFDKESYNEGSHLKNNETNILNGRYQKISQICGVKKPYTVENICKKSYFKIL